MIVVPCAPGPNVPTALGSPQSSKAGRVVFVGGRGSCDLSVLDSPTAHAQGTVTECSCRQVSIVTSTNEIHNQGVIEKVETRRAKNECDSTSNVQLTSEKFFISAANGSWIHNPQIKVEEMLGSFSNDNGNENVTIKMNSRFFKRRRDYSNSL